MNTFSKYWRELFIVTLILIILLMRSCSGESNSSVEIVEVDGKDYELLERKVDTVYVEKEVVVEKYVPKYITRVVTDTIEVPVEVDSLKVVEDYYSRHEIKDTLKLEYDFEEDVLDSTGVKPSKTLGYGLLTDIVTQNTIVSRQIEWNFQIPTVYKTEIVKELPKNEFYYGFGTGFDNQNFISNVRGSVLLKTKSKRIYTLDVGLINNNFGSQNIGIFIGGSMYWKIGKK